MCGLARGVYPPVDGLTVQMLPSPDGAVLGFNGHNPADPIHPVFVASGAAGSPDVHLVDVDSDMSHPRVRHAQGWPIKFVPVCTEDRKSHEILTNTGNGRHTHSL